MRKEAAFVYIVCGDDKHIHTLNTSLKYLKKYTARKVIVITDLSRNQVKIDHNQIIDIKTDEALSHHQAAIFLKTSVHRYLEMKDRLYCYIDTDVLAISRDVDTVFEQLFDTIGFCADNITFDYFSPYVLNCGCIERCNKSRALLQNAIEEYRNLNKKWKDDCNNPSGLDLQQKLDGIKNNKLDHIIPVLSHTFQIIFPFRKQIHLFGYNKNRKTKAWFDKSGLKVLYPILGFEDYVKQKTGFAYNYKMDFWSDKNQIYDVTKPRCRHLHDEIKKRFDINIIPENWQHPNGGVFLFDEKSVEFLERWHSLTLDIFKEDNWKTRDQGTLSVLFWEYGLNKEKYLSGDFNYIIDYFCDVVEYSPTFGFTKEGFKTFSKPVFVHVFHHFGDQEWKVWNTIESFLNN